MEALIRLFGNICRFKKGPEDVPSSLNLLLALLICNLIIEMFLGLTVYSIGLAFFLTSLSVIVLFAFSWVWLLLFQLKERFLQTATAFIGISLFTNILCFIPVTLLWQMGVLVDNSYALVNLVLLIWILSIYAHIYKRALNVSFFLGLALSITYFITFSTLSNYLMGV